jgi:hypothetical protein
MVGGVAAFFTGVWGLQAWAKLAEEGAS